MVGNAHVTAGDIASPDADCKTGDDQSKPDLCREDFRPARTECRKSQPAKQCADCARHDARKTAAKTLRQYVRRVREHEARSRLDDLCGLPLFQSGHE